MRAKSKSKKQQPVVESTPQTKRRRFGAMASALVRKHAAQRSTPVVVDAWQSLVLKTMSVDELQRESENDDNSQSERASMRVELTRRSVAKSPRTWGGEGYDE